MSKAKRRCRRESKLLPLHLTARAVCMQWITCRHYDFCWLVWKKYLRLDDWGNDDRCAQKCCTQVNNIPCPRCSRWINSLVLYMMKQKRCKRWPLSCKVNGIVEDTITAGAAMYYYCEEWECGRKWGHLASFPKIPSKSIKAVSVVCCSVALLTIPQSMTFEL